MRTLALWAVVVASLLLLPVAGAHGPGEEPLRTSGTLLLGPSASGDRFAVTLSSMGAVEGGDVLWFQWSVNGDEAPPVLFSVQVLPQGDEPLYQTQAASATGEVTLPTAADHAVEWVNPNDVEVSVSYVLEVLPGPAPFDFLPVVLLAAAGALFVYLLWRGRRRGTPPAEEQEG